MLVIFNVSSKWTQVIYLRKALRLVIKSVNKSDSTILPRIGHRPFQSPSFFFDLSIFFPPLSLVLFPSSNCCQFSREGHSYKLMITQDNNDHSRDDLWCLAWVFRATILVPSCLERQKERSCSFLLCEGHKESALIFEPGRDKSLTLFVKIMESTGRW